MNRWVQARVLLLAVAIASAFPSGVRADPDGSDGLPARPTKTDVPKLTKKLRDKDPLVRLKAAKLLGGLGADAADALPELTKLLADPDIDVRSVASNAVNKVQAALDSQHSLDALQQKLDKAQADKKALQTQLAGAQKAQQDGQEKLAQRDQHIADQNATIARLRGQMAARKK